MERLELPGRHMSGTTAYDSSQDGSRSNMGLGRSRSHIEISLSRSNMDIARSRLSLDLGRGSSDVAVDMAPNGSLDTDNSNSSSSIVPPPLSLAGLQPKLDDFAETPEGRSALDEERPVGLCGSDKAGSARIVLGGKTELSLRSITSESTIGSKEMPLLRLLVIIGVLSLALFIAAIDQTIVATATVRISEEFDSLSLAPWLANTYLLSSTALQPITGKLSDILGRTQILLSGILVFAVGSVVCAVAKSITVLLVGRGIAGMGAAAIIGLTLVIVSDIVPMRKRGSFMAIFALVFSISSVVGPLLGGLFADRVSWRWIFWLSVPISGIVTIAILLLLRLPHQRQQGDSVWTKLKRIDYLGIALLVGGMVAVLVGLTFPGSGKHWRSPEVIVCLVLGVVIVGCFFVVEGRFARDPIVPLRLFRIRNVAAMMAASFFMGACMFTPIYYVPMYYIVVENTSSTVAGIYLLPFVIGIMITSVGSGLLVMRYGRYRPFIWVGTAVCTVGLGLLALMNAQSTLALRICILLIAGLGIGPFIQLSLIAGQAAVKPEDMATATAVLTFFRSTGSVFGMAVMQTIMSANLRHRLHPLQEQYKDDGRITLDALDNPSVIYQPDVPAGLRDSIIDAYMHSLHLVFIAMIPFGALMFLSTLSLKHITLARRLQPVLAE